MIVTAIAVGTLISYVDPRTGSPLCGRVAYVGEGVAGEPTVWAVQVGGSRAIKAPLGDVTRGCADDRNAASSPAAPASPAQAAPVRTRTGL